MAAKTKMLLKLTNFEKKLWKEAFSPYFWDTLTNNYNKKRFAIEGQVNSCNVHSQFFTKYKLVNNQLLEYGPGPGTVLILKGNL